MQIYIFNLTFAKLKANYYIICPLSTSTVAPTAASNLFLIVMIPPLIT
jgi:hypothetical protein